MRTEEVSLLHPLLLPSFFFLPLADVKIPLSRQGEVICACQKAKLYIICRKSGLSSGLPGLC